MRLRRQVTKHERMAAEVDAELASRTRSRLAELQAEHAQALSRLKAHEAAQGKADT